MALVQARYFQRVQTIKVKEMCVECGISESATRCLNDTNECCEDIIMPKAFFLIWLDDRLDKVNKVLEPPQCRQAKTKLPVLIYKEEDEKLAELAMMYELPFIIIGELGKDTTAEYSKCCLALYLRVRSFKSGEVLKQCFMLKITRMQKISWIKLKDNPDELNYRVNLAEINIQMRDFKAAKLI